MNDLELKEYLISKYHFFRLIGDTLISFENQAFSCATLMAFSLIDILTNFSNKGKTNSTLYSKFIKEYFSVFNEEYKNDKKSNSIYDFRSSLSHSFTLNKKARINNMIPFITYDDFEDNHLNYDKTGKLRILLPVFISEIIIVSEYLFETTIKINFKEYRLTLSNNFVFTSLTNTLHEDLILHHNRINFEKSIHNSIAPLNEKKNYKDKFVEIKRNLLNITERIFRPPLSSDQINEINKNLKPIDLSFFEY